MSLKSGRDFLLVSDAETPQIFSAGKQESRVIKEITSHPVKS